MPGTKPELKGECCFLNMVREGPGRDSFGSFGVPGLAGRPAVGLALDDKVTMAGV